LSAPLTPLDLASRALAWPASDEILTPRGAGPGVFADLAKAKIERSLARLPDATGVRVGVLAIDPAAKATEAPLAVVCVFHRPVSNATLYEAHRLAWNFCRSRLLITVEPHLLRAWSCYEPPDPSRAKEKPRSEIVSLDLDNPESTALQHEAARSLQWLELVTGRFFQTHAERFNRHNRADEMLLANLRAVRTALLDLRRPDHLDQDTCHDIFARVMFIQFLFDRQDSDGKSALNADVLNRLRSEGKLERRYDNFATLLRHHNDAYALFRWLNDRFQGDLFPADWQQEMTRVKPSHLSLLADFIQGDFNLSQDDAQGQFAFSNTQMSLWPLYSFDAIPLEFISSIYEEFVGHGPGIQYTPGHLVDFVLDRVLPWDGTDWNVRVLDPACGSGIFLVKAYQRLIHRWRLANHGKEPRAELLRGLLENNLMGIDRDPHAARVASFSLYLAMCDAIDPRHYWTQVRFPQLRGRRILAHDFFAEDVPDFCTGTARYDVIVGNPPWGKGTLTPEARKWVERAPRKQRWPIIATDIGPLFLAKSAALANHDGIVAMLQPAGTLLFNTRGPARRFRKRLFTELQVEEVTNLSALRFELFPNAIDPACVIVLRPKSPDGVPVLYCCPKTTQASGDGAHIVLEPGDVVEIDAHETAIDPIVWTALLWGGRRDLTFVRRLYRAPNLTSLRDDTKTHLDIREGVIRGNRERHESAIANRRMLEASVFPLGTFLMLDASGLPVNHDDRVDGAASNDFSAFRSPQLIIKQGWQKHLWRFQAALVRKGKRGVVCSQSYISVHVPRRNETVLARACLAYNSIVAVYFLLLASGRLASYRPEPLVEEFLRVPLPDRLATDLTHIHHYDTLDALVREAYGFKDAEWVLIEDLVRCTLADFKGDSSSPGRQPTARKGDAGEVEPQLAAYCAWFVRVLKAGFGPDKRICATIFYEDGAPLSVRLVAIHLDWPGHEPIKYEPITYTELENRLRILEAQPKRGDRPYFARFYSTVPSQTGEVPTVFLVKPDRQRYWLRSVAMRDADDVAADIIIAGAAHDRKKEWS
jgi:N-6 DNA Methylase